GSAHEPEDKAGLADAARDFLSTPLDGDVFGRLGIQRAGGVDSDRTAFFARSISIYQEEMLKALERWVVAGEYNQESIERWQKDLKDTFSRPSVRQNQV